MQQGRSHTKDRIQQLSKTMGKNKSSQSKQKRQPQTQNVPTLKHAITSLINSPYNSKQMDTDNKQNFDVVGFALKIVSAAAESKQKQILLALAAQIEKQQKIRSYLHKDSNTNNEELLTLLNHLKQQQQKSLRSLKVQIGKRKLQNLDEHDLRQDILNLNSYILRRSKKQTIAVKSTGVDLIGQIYNKFDEQNKVINQLRSLVDMKNKSKLIQQKKKLIITSPTSQDQKQTILFKEQNSLKLLKLQKQNSKLNKDIIKIQQQFECIVEEKLILQQKMARTLKEKQTRNKNILFVLKSIKQQVNELKQSLQLLKSDCFQKLEDTKKVMNHFQFQVFSKVLEFKQQSFHSDEETKSCRQEDQTSLIEKYQSLLTQKQFQINKYLKTISKNNEQKNQMTQELMKTKKQCFFEIETVANKQKERKQKFIYSIMSLYSQIKHLKNHFRDDIADGIRTLKQQAEQNFSKVSAKIEAICSMTVIEAKSKESILAEYIEKQKLSSENIVKIQDEKQSLKIKNRILQQSLENLQNQILHLKQQLQQTSQTQSKICELNLIIEQLQSKNKELLVETSRCRQQLQQTIQKNQKLIVQEKNILIEECGMLLETKTNQITKIEKQFDVLRLQNQKHKQAILKLKNQYTFLLSFRENFTFIKNNIQDTQQHFENFKFLIDEKIRRIEQKQQCKKINPKLSVESLVLQMKIQNRYFLEEDESVIDDIIKIINQWNGLSMQDLKNQSITEKLLKIKNSLLDFRFQFGEYSENEPALNKIASHNSYQICDMFSPRQTLKEQTQFLDSFKNQNFTDFLDQIMDFNVNQILNQSSIVPEIQVLKIELASLNLQNENLTKQLKVYRQKDIDKIFDF